MKSAIKSLLGRLNKYWYVGVVLLLILQFVFLVWFSHINNTQFGGGILALGYNDSSVTWIIRICNYLDWLVALNFALLIIGSIMTLIRVYVHETVAKIAKLPPLSHKALNYFAILSLIILTVALVTTWSAVVYVKDRPIACGYVTPQYEATSENCGLPGEPSLQSPTE